MGGNHFKGGIAKFDKLVTKTLTEGGNVFKGKTGPIKLENIEPTVERYFDELKKVFPKKKDVFNKSNFRYVGSVGKKPQSGDIDFAIDSKVFVGDNFSDKSIKEWGVNPDDVKANFEKFKKRARTTADSELMIRALMLEIAKKVNKKADTLHFNEKKVTPAAMFGLFPQYDESGNMLENGVQMDWLVGPVDWLEFSYYSDAYKDNVKGLHRTQLIVALFQTINMTFQHGKGVKDKETGEYVATTPTEAIEVLNDKLGTNFNKTSINDYFQLIEHVKQTLSKSDYDNLLHEYFKIMERTRADIPYNIQEDWLRLNKKNKYQTKFLPDNSALHQHI